MFAKRKLVFEDEEDEPVAKKPCLAQPDVSDAAAPLPELPATDDDEETVSWTTPSNSSGDEEDDESTPDDDETHPPTLEQESDEPGYVTPPPTSRRAGYRPGSSATPISPTPTPDAAPSH